MKIAICHLCHRVGSDIDRANPGGWVQFADYTPESVEIIGHPQGLEWFCYEHLASAQALKHRTSGDALAELQKQFGVFQKPNWAALAAQSENEQPSLWNRIKTYLGLS